MNYSYILYDYYIVYIKYEFTNYFMTLCLEPGLLKINSDTIPKTGGKKV